MKIIYRIVCAAALLLPWYAHAGVEISEIMYDIEGTDTGREWVEVYNGSTADIDLSTWKLFEANVAHKITATGDPILLSGGRAIVADSPEKFLADNPGFSGSVFDSAFSLSNGGETIALKDAADAIVDSVTYEGAWGAAGDGNTLQKNADGAWIAAKAMPGSATDATESVTSAPSESPKENPSEESTANASSYSAHSSQVAATMSYDAPEIVVTTGRPRLGFVGVPLSFEAKIKSAKNLPVTARSTYVWSMGDGTRENGQFIAHSYEFPGDYIVILNVDSGGAKAVSKMSVRIVVPNISARAEPEHVEISNLDSHELNFGGFLIETGGGRFYVPEDTIIAPKSKLRLSLAMMRLQYGRTVSILTPMKKVVVEATSPLRTADSEVLISLPPGFNTEDLRARLEAKRE
jgi:hypothetical protein